MLFIFGSRQWWCQPLPCLSPQVWFHHWGLFPSVSDYLLSIHLFFQMPENNSKLHRKINHLTFFRVIEPRVGKSLRMHHVQAHTTLKNPTTSLRWPATGLGVRGLYSRPSGCLGLSYLTEFLMVQSAIYSWPQVRNCEVSLDFSLTP